MAVAAAAGAITAKITKNAPNCQPEMPQSLTYVLTPSLMGVGLWVNDEGDAAKRRQ